MLEKAGFSGIEFLIAALLISIAVMISLPDSDRFLSAFRVHSAAREVASELQLARMRAIAKNTRFRMTFIRITKPTSWKRTSQVSGKRRSGPRRAFWN